MLHLSLDRLVDIPSTKKKIRGLDDSWKVGRRLDMFGYSRTKPESKHKDKASTSSKGQYPMDILIEEMQ